MTIRAKNVQVEADQMAQLKPYLDIKGVSLASVVREALADHIECTISTRLESIQGRLNKA